MPGFSWCGELITEHKEELYDSEERYDSKEELYASELTGTGSSGGADGGANGQSINTSATIAVVVQRMTSEEARDLLERLLTWRTCTLQRYPLARRRSKTEHRAWREMLRKNEIRERSILKERVGEPA